VDPSSGLEGKTLELQLAVLPLSGELLTGGGQEQRRSVLAYDSSGQRLTVDGAFDPAARPGQGWRIRTERLRASASASAGNRLRL